MESTRTDLTVGLVFLGCAYGVEWIVRRRRVTRLERFAAGTRRAGRATRVGSVALARAAIVEGDLLPRTRRVS